MAKSEKELESLLMSVILTFLTLSYEKRANIPSAVWKKQQLSLIITRQLIIHNGDQKHISWTRVEGVAQNA